MKLTNRDLATISLVLLLLALMITLFPTATYAQGGGRCNMVSYQYWSPAHQAYITAYKWQCSGYHQPRSFRGGYGSYGYGYTNRGYYYNWGY